MVGEIPQNHLLQCVDSFNNGRIAKNQNGGKTMRRKIVASIIGLVAGAITIPIAVFIWPLFLAYFFFNESEED